MFSSRNPAQGLPTTRTLKWNLGLLVLLYISLAAFGAWLIARGGYSWDGDTERLTTILAVLGVIFTFTARMLQSQCQTARMQFLAGKAIEHSVPLRDIHEMDMAIRGGDIGLSSLSTWSLFYRALLPFLAIAMSAALKKTMTVDVERVPHDISASDTVLQDPINTEDCHRTPAFPGAIMYNTTSGYSSHVDPTQTSWTYIIANQSDPTGLESVTFSMPWWPTLVAEGQSGYVNYTASEVPRLSASVQCSIWESLNFTADVDKFTTPYDPSYNIKNANNAIFYWEKRTTITVITNSSIAWNCTAEMGVSRGNASYMSDGNGNWNLTSMESSPSTSVSFITPALRLTLSSIVTSDILGSASTSIGWCWDAYSFNETQLSQMLIATRLSFATSLLGITNNRNNSDSSSTTSPPGDAYILVTKIKLLSNWSLRLTIALLGLQGVLAFSHLIFPSSYRIDFSLLQVMEMQQATHDDENGSSVAPLLTGHCSTRRNDVEVDANVSIRFDEASNHLGIVKDGVEGSDRWKRINEQHVVL